MTPRELRLVLAAIRWSQGELARALGCSDRLVRMWAAGDAPVPPQVAEWLEALYRAHDTHKPPTAFRKPRTAVSGK